MKKLFVLIIVFAMALAFAACGAGGNSPAQQTETSEPVEQTAGSSLSPSAQPAVSTQPSESVTAEPATTSDYAKAYLDILLEHEATIKAHQIFSVEQGERVGGGKIAIADMNGDTIPELIYMEDHSDPWPGFYQAGLYIWTYDGEEAVLAFSNDSLFKEVGGTMNYTLILTPANEIYVYEAWGNEASNYIFNGYMLVDGELQPKTTFQYGISPTDDYSDMIEEYSQDDMAIDKTQYDALVSQATGADGSVLMTSYTSPDQYWNLSLATMTCDEAIVSLQKLVDPQTDSDIDVSAIRVDPAPFWNSDKTSFDIAAYLWALGAEETEYTLVMGGEETSKSLNGMYNDCLITVWCSDSGDVYVKCAYNFSNLHSALTSSSNSKGWWAYDIEMWSDEINLTSENTVLFWNGNATQKQVEIVIDALNRIVNNTEAKNDPFSGFARHSINGYDDGGINTDRHGRYDENLLPWSE